MTDSNRKKVLYIEDDAESRELMADILHLHGYRFLGASRGLEGIRLATRELPNLILMDMNLPDMQGYEVTTLLKSIDALKTVPVIALTAEIDKGARERTLTAGCDGYIAKPINVTEFVQRIEEYLEGRKDTLDPREQSKYLTEYNIRLVEKLQNKLEELEKVNSSLSMINEELTQSREQLTEYNNRLFYMNNLANLLRMQKSPDDLIRMLPQKIIEGFGIDRCIIFDYDSESEKLTSITHAGIAGLRIEKLKLKLKKEFYYHLKQEMKFLWVKSKEEILDPSLLKVAQHLNSISFVLSCIPGMGSSAESSGIFLAIATHGGLESSENISIEIPKKMIIFLDRGYSQTPFATYEIRILKAFLQSTSIIYENMLLYHKMMKLYRIKEQEAITDPLTGAYNYRFFASQIEREIERSARHKKPFSLAMIDIDNFKQYNDTYGHVSGDKVLKLVAEALVRNTRKSDIVARYGGDEFLIILPEMGKDNARTVAEKLCKIIEKTKFPRHRTKKRVNLTISLGIASFPDDGNNERVLLKKADTALYAAKESGRNTVRISA